jgi:hypothetical protein
VKRLQRALLMGLMGVVGLNIWTGNPLLALWVGSRVVGSGPLTMGAVAAVGGMMGAVGFALVRLLAILGAAYDRVTGHTATVRHHVPWLRSMSGERVEYQQEREGMAALEIVLVAMVIVAFAAFEVWFFFFSTSPIDQRSGRG